MNLYEMFNGAKKKLSEGGNLSVGGQEAQQIDLKVHNRSYIVPILDTLLRNINNSFAKTYKKPLWNPALLQKKEFLSGSSLHFFNTKGISDQDFVAKKPKVGDIDTQVNKENEQELEQWLTASQGKMVGNAKFIGFQRGNEQFSSLWELQDPPIKVQIDLEFVAFEKDEPTPWAKFSHSSSWDDLNAGVKGVFHKFLIQSLAALSRKDFLLRKAVGRGKAKELQDIPTTDNMVSFAVSSKEGGGLRAKYEPIVDANGQPVIKDGLPVMQALPASGYEQDIGKIFASIFADRLNAKKAKQLESKYWSFVGLIDAMNALLTPEEKQTVLGAFIDKTFGKGAQGLYRGDPERDSVEKSAALNLMISKLGVQAPADLEQIKQQYKAAYKVVAESLTEAPDYKRQGIQHIYAPGSSTEMKDLDFIEMCKEIAQNGGTLDGMAVNLKADGAGIRFGKDAAGRPFFMTSKVTEPKYAENIGDFERFGVEQGQPPERLAFTKKYDDAMSIILNSDFIKTLPDDTIVQAEMMYNDMAQQTPQGLKFVNIPYDAKKLGKTMTLVPFMFKTFSTGETRPDAEAIKKKLLSMSDNNIKMVNNQLQQKGIDVSKIIEPVVNMDPQLVAALSSRVRNNPGKEQAKEILTAARQQLSQAIIENPNLKGKDQLGNNMEGIVINLPSGRLAKVTSQLMKDTMAAKKAPQAAPAKQGPTKTAVVAIGSFVGHKGHQELFKYTIDKAKEVGGDPYLFMGNAVGVDDPVPVEDKIKTWKQLYPSYAGNISATMQGGSLMQKIKHELINPMPGQPPKYDNVIIMVGEDQAGMNIANALMKAVNKFPGYEHVKVSLEVTPRGTGMSFTKLRNILKTGDEQTATNMWTDAFNGGNSGAKPLPPQWIKHLMDVSKKGMGIVQPQPAVGVPMAEMRLFNALINPNLIKESDVSRIAALNNIKDVNKIQIGQTLKLPDGTIYTVSKGDTLSGIAAGKFKGKGPVLPATTSTPAGAGRGGQGGPTAKELAAYHSSKSSSSPTPPTANTSSPAPVAKKEPEVPANAVKSSDGSAIKTGSGGNVVSGTPIPDAKAVAAAKAKLTPSQLKWLGDADPTDPAIMARMPKPLPNEKTSDQKIAGQGEIRSALSKIGISDPNAQANILAQIKAESEFQPRSEELERYSAKTLYNLYGGPVVDKTKSGRPLNAKKNIVRFNSPEEAEAVVAKGPVAVGDIIYGGRMGNDQPGDGYKYRGRGLIQITGKSNYALYSKKLGVDLVKNPDLANDPEIAVQIAALYFKDKEKQGVDLSNIDAVGKSVGFAGGKDEFARRAKFAKSFSSTKTTEETSPAMAHTAKSLENPPKVMQHRAKRDQEREQQLKYRDIAKRNEAMLPKSAFTGSDKNKLGSAGQLKGTAPKKQPTHKLVGETNKNKCVPIGEAWSIEMAKAVIKLVEGKK